MFFRRAIKSFDKDQISKAMKTHKVSLIIVVRKERQAAS